MKSRIAPAVFSVVLLVLSQASARAESEPRRLIRETTDAVIAVLQKQNLSASEKRRQIEDIVDDHFDFETLSRLALGQNWKKLSETEQQEFTREFRRHLAATYGRNVESYNNEKVVITGEREEKRGDWTIKTRIARGGAGKDIFVDYRLRKNGRWRIIDVIIEGVSLVANFRSQFQDIVNRRGVLQLIALLKEKNARNEPLEPQ